MAPTAAPTTPTTPTVPAGKRKPLGRLIGAFKTVSTKRINEHRGTAGAIIWQRNYYEHIIRHAESLNRIRAYILDNPLQWHLDHERAPATDAPPWADE
ncbi:transposase [Chloracidobacterium sp. D]|uniref:transposase n=1 Tax=Chloracidobacterium sp. D TaxID=2821536 RepID=UPI0035302294